MTVIAKIFITYVSLRNLGLFLGKNHVNPMLHLIGCYYLVFAIKLLIIWLICNYYNEYIISFIEIIIF